MARLELVTAARRLRRDKTSSSIIVLLLALGIAVGLLAARLIFGILHQPLPYPAPEQLVLVSQQAPGADIALDRIPLSEAGYLHFRDHNNSFSNLAAVHERSSLFETGQLESEHQLRRVETARSTADLPQVLGVDVVLGRWFGTGDTRPGAPPTTVLSYDLWQGTFGGDPAVLGKQVRIDNIATTVIGIMPNGFSFPWEATALWRPLEINETAPDSGGHYLRGIARLKPEITTEQARKDLDGLLSSLSEKHPEQYSQQLLDDWQFSTVVNDLSADMTRSIRPMLNLALLATLLVLAVCCLNPALLLSARVVKRRSELSTRRALGASRLDLMRELVAEPLLLTGFAALVGFGVAHFVTSLLINADLPFRVPRLVETLSSPAGLLWLLPVAVSAVVLLSLPLLSQVPGERISLRDLEHRISPRRGRSAQTLVALQVALVVILVFGASLLLRSSRNVLETQLGYETPSERGLLTFSVTLPTSRFPDPSSRRTFDLQLDAALTALPGVQASASSDGPLLSTSRNAYHFLVDRSAFAQPVERDQAITGRAVSADFFVTTGQPILAGRSFDSDQAKRQVIVNQAFVERYGIDRSGNADSSSGLLLRVGTVMADKNVAWSEVVGVAANTLDPETVAESEPIVYTPLSYFGPGLSKTLQTSVPANSLSQQVKSAVAQIDPTLPLEGLRSFSQALRLARWQVFFLQQIMLIGALLALVAGAVGLAGVAIQTVEAKLQDAGIRIALGASAFRAGSALLAGTRRAVVVGILLGAAGSILLAGRLKALLFGVTTADPFSLLLALGLAGATAIVCALLAISSIDDSRPLEILQRD